MKELKVGTWIAYPNKLGQSEYGRFIKKIYRMHKFKTELELEKVNGVHVYLREDSDWITVQESMAEQLEEVRKENLREVNKMLLGVNDVYENEYNQSNDVQQRKRKDENVGLFKIKDLKVGYKVKVLGDNMTGEVSEIADNGKSAEIQVDDGVYRVINDNNDFTITEWNAVPEYAEDTVNHPSHYNYGDIEVIDYCDQVCKQYPPELAPYVFNAIKYLSRANHKNGLEDIDKAKYYVQRLFDKWDQ
ncbi:DUF3310 domain-containing protein [Staphylococcus sp. GDY8P193P]|uniref:DUF3310 domain-containing protein n=1 Tax=Staphylococcus sp. GDY8P193P TaxID=2804171 RepID=UPI001AEC6E80|nr:DUF3310 domain-containing protein [Staphylococcus sp. GDY8P193P]